MSMTPFEPDLTTDHPCASWLAETQHDHSPESPMLAPSEGKSDPSLTSPAQMLPATGAAPASGAGRTQERFLESIAIPLPIASFPLSETSRQTRNTTQVHPTPEDVSSLPLTPLSPLAAQLRQALQTQLPAHDIPVLDYLLSTLDEDGYLHASIQEAAEECQIPAERVEQVLIVLQQQEPVGVGARNVQECLLLQLRYWEARGVHQPFARELLEQALPELAARQYHQIARKLGMSVQQAHMALIFIQQTLHPFPLLADRRERSRGLDDPPGSTCP